VANALTNDDKELITFVKSFIVQALSNVNTALPSEKLERFAEASLTV
jgi:hypothetical protein